MQGKKETVLSLEQLGLILGISIITAKKLVKEGELPCKYVKRRPVIRLDALIRRFEQLSGGAA
jgi:hypothetical protein